MLTLKVIVFNRRAAPCRRKMRMSGLCKVEMSGFIPMGGRDGNGANRVEHERAGAVKGAAASRRRSSEAGRSRAAAALDGSSDTAIADTSAQRRGSRNRTPVARASFEPEDP